MLASESAIGTNPVARAASARAKAPPPMAAAVRPASQTLGAIDSAETTRSTRWDSPASCATSHATQATSGGWST